MILKLLSASNIVRVFGDLVSLPLARFVKVSKVVKVPFVNGLVSLGNMAQSVDAKTRSEWIVVGISGVTCGGKTTLAHRLRDALAPVYVFHQDQYFYPDDSPKHVKCQNLPHNNYDILSSLDMAAFHQDVISTMQGRNRAHVTVTEADGREQLQGGKKLLVLEGFTTLNYRPINELCDLRYYFILEYAECLSRRVLRLYDPPDIDGYFDQCVWPEHIKYRAEIEKDKRVKLLDGTTPDVFEVVMNDIRTLVATKVA